VFEVQTAGGSGVQGTTGNQSESRGLRSEDEIVFSANVFAALGNATRLRIVDLLIERECTVNEVAQRLGIQQPNASLNLATLHRAGILKVTAKGAHRCYAVRGPRIERILSLASEFRDVHESAIQAEDICPDTVAADEPAVS
jgi:DNA-binding transcriptional ArsR family regulator